MGQTRCDSHDKMKNVIISSKHSLKSLFEDFVLSAAVGKFLNFTSGRVEPCGYTN